MASSCSPPSSSSSSSALQAHAFVGLCGDLSRPLLGYLTRLDVVRLQRVSKQVRRRVNETEHWKLEAATLRLRRYDATMYSARGLCIVATMLDRLRALEDVVVGVWWIGGRTKDDDGLFWPSVFRDGGHAASGCSWAHAAKMMTVSSTDCHPRDEFSARPGDSPPAAPAAFGEDGAVAATDLRQFLWCCFSGGCSSEALVRRFHKAVRIGPDLVLSVAREDETDERSRVRDNVDAAGFVLKWPKTREQLAKRELLEAYDALEAAEAALEAAQAGLEAAEATVEAAEAAMEAAEDGLEAAKDAPEAAKATEVPLDATSGDRVEAKRDDVASRRPSYVLQCVDFHYLMKHVCSGKLLDPGKRYPGELCDGHAQDRWEGKSPFHEFAPDGLWFHDQGCAPQFRSWDAQNRSFVK